MARKKAQPTPTSPPELRGRLDHAMRAKKFQIALELARYLLRCQPTPENRHRLIECCLGFGRQLSEQGKPRDALDVLETGSKLAENEPALVVRLAEEFARAGDVSRGLQLLEGVPQPRPANKVLAFAADQAVPRGDAGRAQLPASLRPDFDQVRTAFAHAEAGRDEAARAALQMIGLASPFLEWRVLLRGLLAYYANDDQRAIDNWSRLDADRLPARIAAPLRLAIDADFAAVQPPATQHALRRQLERLHGDRLPGALRNMQSALAHKPLASILREAEKLLPRLKDAYPDLAARLARIFYWEMVERGELADTARYQQIFGKPADDPDFKRMAALAMERDTDYLLAHAEWLQYQKSLAKLTALSEAERARAAAMIWLRMASNAARPVPRRSEIVSLIRGEQPRQPFKPAAEVCLRKAVAQAPDWLEPHAALVDMLRARGDARGTIAAAEALLQQFPEHLPALEALAGALLDVGDLGAAVAATRRSIAVNPLNRPMHARLAHLQRRFGTALAEQGDFAAARSAFEAACNTPSVGSQPLAAMAWAACEFKSGNSARAEELVRQARQASGTDTDLDAWMHAHVVLLKLPRAIRMRFETPLKEALGRPQSTPQQAAALIATFRRLHEEGFEYFGCKTHLKKAVAQVEKTTSQPYSEELARQVGQALLQLSAMRVLRKLAARWTRELPSSGWPPFFAMESYLDDDEVMWPLWKVGPLAERAKVLAEKMPPGESRDQLLGALERRLTQLRALNSFAGAFAILDDDFEPADETDRSFQEDPW